MVVRYILSEIRLYEGVLYTRIRGVGFSEMDLVATATRGRGRGVR
jgi:hypothetical protein